MRNWEIRARAGSEEGDIGSEGGRVNCDDCDFEEPVGMYVRKRYEVE